MNKKYGFSFNATFPWRRCLAKTLTWRLCVFGMFVFVVWAFVPRDDLAALCMCAPILLPYAGLKTICYFIHEGLWS